jgi:hypothetical protein
MWGRLRPPHQSAPRGSPKSKANLPKRKKLVAFARAREPECASRAKIKTTGESVFFISPQTRIASSEIDFDYDELVSGSIIYTYVQDNPISLIDPLGLTNLVAQIGGSIVPGLGVEGSVGIYVTLPTNGNNFDMGVFASGGFATGFNVGGGNQYGIIKGNESDIQGVTYNVNGGAAVGSGTLMFDDKGNLVGGTLGPAADLGLSASYTKTGAWGLNDLGNALGGWLYDKLHPKPCK